MASGIGIHDDVKSAFKELLVHREHRGLILRVSSDMTLIEVDKILPVKEGVTPQEEYDSYASLLSESECRYFIYDFEYVASDVKKSRVVLICWTPETSHIKSKMMYASSKISLQGALDGIQTMVQATDTDEITYDAVKAVIQNSAVSY
uniref:ADF-H domain-containing protein n=1 Tax=Rhodosorus marinus TaxID=101924 RepID=A0A7S2ZRV6_9RHOD|mmetsp:Transcript_30458/g.116686  ORF Transcript_30458/g.116686 Transcript_30458/m.116686 type:complete len:148 (+) Transcript_30458:189-632(+)|eukprot:CAMPEP_0113968290 /NCGR_PEP_ID=MMETSP0011_2-20120614/9442_1 /TAXON_ID=101924 /ORGANISM="Rhodosorus marinus" /LENGTH=147 /DNA_ID=CAMNT_0000981345 /DNA_START=59 /DNA_END=502 /DNA_ORIENTATION=+ /assembly_acc=CAM_ASM_000156